MKALTLAVRFGSRVLFLHVLELVYFFTLVSRVKMTVLLLTPLLTLADLEKERSNDQEKSIWTASFPAREQCLRD